MKAASYYREMVGRRRSQDLFLLFVLLSVAIITRSYGIWEWSLIGDEYYTVTYAEERSRRFFNPAYYALVVGSIKLFGLTEWSVRLPAVVWGVLGIPICFFAYRSLFGRTAAITGSLFLMFSGWHVYFSQLSRFYSGVFVFGAVSYFVYYAALRRDSYGLLAGALLSNVLGILFHATSVMVPAACAAYSALILVRKKNNTAGYSRRVAAMHFILCGIGGLMALPFFLGIVQEWGAGTGSWIAGPVDVLLQLIKNLGPVLAVSSLLGLVLLLRKDLSKGLFFALGMGIPLGVLLLGSVLVPPVRDKYIFYAFPLIIALSAFLCAEISVAVSKRSIVAYAIPVLIIVAMMPGFVSYYTGKSSLDVREAIAVIEQGYKPGDKIIAFSHSVAGNLKGEYPDEGLQILGGKGLWRRVLPPLEQGTPRAWILVDTYRNPLMNRELESWLLEHASLVWRKYEKRYDYSMMGYEVYVVNGP